MPAGGARMDEAEKYQQRLQAIAEKRRVQEEQDRAKREMEDEKLRLQQLKRKSLRDQWLMEGPPLSPTSSDDQSPRSPLWGSQAQEIEKHIDKLQTESQQLAEEEEKLKEQIEDGQTEAVKVTEAMAAVHGSIVQNGQEKATESEATEDEVKGDLSPLLDEVTVALTNGGGAGEAEANHVASEENAPFSSNGPTGAPGGAVTMTFLGYSEAEPGQVPNARVDGEEDKAEEGTLVMRAERVIITDEGDDVPEDLPPRGEQEEAVQSEGDAQPSSETPGEGGETVEEAAKPGETVEQAAKPGETVEEAAKPGETVEEEVKPGEVVETSLEPEEEREISEAVSPNAEADKEPGDGEAAGDVETNKTGDGETTADGGEDKSEPPVPEQLHSPADTLDVSAVASVPVYTEAQPSSLTPRAEAEGESDVVQPAGDAPAEPEDAAPERGEADSNAQEPAALPGQFQEVPLADPKENQKAEAGPEEQEPLLTKAKAPHTQAEPATTSTETHAPNRATQGGETAAPKQKNCQCCSVM
ncbi:paralemmin-3 isoform 2-T2 [Polymixia lowei]